VVVWVFARVFKMVQGWVIILN